MRDPRRRRAEDRDTQRRDDDVAVARLVATVDRRMGDSVRQHDHDALDRDDLDLDLEQPGDEARPGSGRVDDRLASDARLFAGHGLASQHFGHTVTVLAETGDLGVRPDLRAAAPRRFNVPYNEIEGVEVPVFRNPENGPHLFGERRLAPAGLPDRGAAGGV